MLTALAAITLACLVHPGLGLLVLLLSHALCCHTALCRIMEREKQLSILYQKQGRATQFPSPSINLLF
ncbi:hypothetical protein RchiOBHm_Chr5g0058211 [Rosa chinensis]|uniref:Uncharacterized protein n=1 Tax=Rosa chinensis TaxID=74649 RepID=A0A2P6QH51_ROSCH|nr:hypothetical protein RchiOBHm_Chr5g0058211 [Rosa chinensis]